MTDTIFVTGNFRPPLRGFASHPATRVIHFCGVNLEHHKNLMTSWLLLVVMVVVVAVVMVLLVNLYPNYWLAGKNSRGRQRGSLKLVGRTFVRGSVLNFTLQTSLLLKSICYVYIYIYMASM